MTDLTIRRLENDGLRLELNPAAGAVSIARRDGKIAFGPLVGRAKWRRADQDMRCPTSSLIEGWAVEALELETPLGPRPGFRAVLDGVAGLSARIVWELALLGPEELAARLVIENQDRDPIAVNELCPLAYRGADPGLDLGAGYLGWRWYRTGYQSWSPAGSIGAIESDHAPRFFLPSRAGVSPLSPYSRRPGEKVADWMGQLVEPKLGLGALLGFITAARLAGRVEFEVKYDRFRRFEAINDLEGARLEPGATLASEWAILSLSADPLGQQARYFELWGQAMKARVGGSKTGWCSWYFKFWNVDEATLNSNLRELEEKFKGRLELVQIDDGFEPVVGEWTQWNQKFFSPPAQIAHRIRDRGFSPGLWLAPFLVSRSAPLYKQHRDWAVKNQRGGPVINFIHPAWKGHVMYALDLTHPGVIAWLQDTVREIVHAHGFKYLKLDFLYAGAAPGVRHDRSATGVSALRRGLEAIREAAGEDVYLLGCGCPLGPAVGLVDAMRVSQDVDVRWRVPLLDAVSGVPTGPGAGNCLKNNLARMLTHRRLWANDPDCAVLRDVRGGMNPDEIKSLLTVLYLTGGPIILSENLAGCPPERLAWLEAMLPPSGLGSVPIDLFEKDFPETVIQKSPADPGSVLAAVFNWTDAPAERGLELARLGLEGTWRAFDFWAEQPRSVVDGAVALGALPAHGCKLLRLVPADDRPRLLGTNLHLGMGSAHFETALESGALKIQINLPGRRQGKLWIALPGGGLKIEAVSFTDQTEVVVAL